MKKWLILMACAILTLHAAAQVRIVHNGDMTGRFVTAHGRASAFEQEALDVAARFFVGERLTKTGYGTGKARKGDIVLWDLTLGGIPALPRKDVPEDGYRLVVDAHHVLIAGEGKGLVYGVTEFLRNQVGIDYWGAVWDYSKELCEKNALSEGVGDRCIFQRGDANKLEFPDESFDAVISNYVYHNITNASDKQALLKESLRVLKKGGVFVLQDDMKPGMFGDMDAFIKELKAAGYQDVRLIDTAEEIFGSKSRAKLLALGNSAALVGRK